MKKLFPLAIIAVALTFTSCKKNYTCTCTETATGMTPITVSSTIKDTKSNAKSKCNTSVNASTLGVGYSVTCAIQ